MAINESDREDLMREATALRRRLEVVVPDEEESIIVGFRDDDRFSIFFGADPAYHFNAEGQLRRSYFQGKLYRTQGTTLARLTRQRTPGESHLLRHDLTPDELDEFLRLMNQRLNSLAEHIEAGSAKVLSQIPKQPPLLPTIYQALQRILDITHSRLAPAIKA